jgi:transcriptional regulator with XRE-family HTH domain
MAQSDPARHGWQRLGHLIAAERGRRRWSAEELATRSGLSKRTIDYLEGGQRRRFRSTTLGAIEDAFGWRPGTSLGIVEGMEPVPTRDQLLERVLDRWPHLTEEQQQAIVELLESITTPRQG